MRRRLPAMARILTPACSHLRSSCGRGTQNPHLRAHTRGVGAISGTHTVEGKTLPAMKLAKQYAADEAAGVSWLPGQGTPGTPSHTLPH